MGQAKRRGTYIERKTLAVSEGRTKVAKATKATKDFSLKQIPLSAAFIAALLSKSKKYHL